MLLRMTTQEEKMQFYDTTSPNIQLYHLSFPQICIGNLAILCLCVLFFAAVHLKVTRKAKGNKDCGLFFYKHASSQAWVHERREGHERPPWKALPNLLYVMFFWLSSRSAVTNSSHVSRKEGGGWCRGRETSGSRRCCGPVNNAAHFQLDLMCLAFAKNKKQKRCYASHMTKQLIIFKMRDGDESWLNASALAPSQQAWGDTGGMLWDGAAGRYGDVAPRPTVELISNSQRSLVRFAPAT